LAVVRVSGASVERVQQVAHLVAERGRELQKRFTAYRELWILGPSEYPLARLRNQHRYQVLLKGAKANVINTFVRQVIGDRKWVLPQVKVQVDVDPMNML
jgi:primosomal protein N' (replication factor Y)